MPETLREFISEYAAEKKARYAEFEVLLRRAALAGDAAAEAARSRSAGMPRLRGPVSVRLEDGRTSFARFTRTEHAAEWRRGNRRTGNYLPVRLEDFRASRAYAEAFCEVLAGGGIIATVQARAITDPEAPDAGR